MVDVVPAFELWSISAANCMAIMQIQIFSQPCRRMRTSVFCFNASVYLRVYFCKETRTKHLISHRYSWRCIHVQHYRRRSVETPHRPHRPAVFVVGCDWRRSEILDTNNEFNQSHRRHWARIRLSVALAQRLLWVDRVDLRVVSNRVKILVNFGGSGLIENSGNLFCLLENLSTSDPITCLCQLTLVMSISQCSISPYINFYYINLRKRMIYVNPLECSGVRELHFKMFNATQPNLHNLHF